MLLRPPAGFALNGVTLEYPKAVCNELMRIDQFQDELWF